MALALVPLASSHASTVSALRAPASRLGDEGGWTAFKHARSETRPLISVIVPAKDEACYIGETLDALLGQSFIEEMPGALSVIVAANGCRDDTVAVASSYEAAFRERNVRFQVLDLPEPGKARALNAALAKTGEGRIAFLDADICLDPSMLSEIYAALDTEIERYASGRFAVTRPNNWLVNAYLDTWLRLPFHDEDAIAGAGFFAVNEKGRELLGAFPEIIADDLYARLSFQPSKRVQVEARYHWRISDRFWEVVKMRKRQDDGMNELFRLYPHMADNESKASLGAVGHLKLMAGGPLGYIVYCAVRVLGKFLPTYSATNWARGH